MASTDSLPVPKKNTAFRLYFMMYDSDGVPVTSLSSPDSEVSKDGGAFADCTNEATHVGHGQCYIDLTSTEMNADHVGFHCADGTSNSGEVISIAPAENLDIPVDARGCGGTPLTGRDIGASVLLSSGTGSGQVSLSSGTVTVGTNNDKTGYSLTDAAVDAIAAAANGELINDVDEVLDAVGRGESQVVTLGNLDNYVNGDGMTIQPVLSGYGPFSAISLDDGDGLISARALASALQAELEGDSDLAGKVTVTYEEDSRLLDDMVSYWRLDEASGTRNDDHGANHLTDNNTVGTSAGKIDDLAASFNSASSEYLSRTSNSTLQTGDINFSFAFWAYPTGGGNGAIIGKDDGSSREYTVYWNGTQWVLMINGTNQVSVNGTLNAWNFVVCWRDRDADKFYLQVNGGSASESSTGTTPTSGGAQFRIGAWGYSGGGLYFDGRIGPVAFWKRVLTPLERDALYNESDGVDYPEFAIETNGTRLIVFDGNSQTTGYEQTGIETWPTQCVALLDGYTEVNVAVTSQDTNGMAADADSEIDTQFSQQNERNILVAFEGVNDIYLNSASAETAYANLVSYYQGRQSAGWTVISGTLLYDSRIADATIDATNALIRANYATFSSRLADINADSRLAVGAIGRHSDGIHLSIAGNGVIAEIVAAEILALENA